MKTLKAAAAIPALLAAAAQAPPDDASLPEGPFRTVHLIVVTPDQQTALAAALGQVNRAMAAAGCATCSYHLYGLFAGTGAKPNAMVTADWPGRAEYRRVHAAPGYADANRRNPAFAALGEAEYYGRFVEVR